MRVHMRMSIEGCLRNKGFEGFTFSNGNPMTREQAEHYLRLELEKGIKYLPVGDCDNFSETEGCLGHKD